MCTQWITISKYMKQKLTQLQRKVGESTVILGVFSFFHLSDEKRKQNCKDRRFKQWNK